MSQCCLVTSPSLFSNNISKALHLVLSATKSTNTTLNELPSTLVLGVSDKLHSSALVGSETGDFADYGADNFDAFSLATFTVGGTGSKDSSLSGVTTVDAPNETWK